MLTFEITEEGDEIEIHGDREGLVSLLRAISTVLESGDHDHLMSPSWGGKELAEEKQGETNDLVNKVSIYSWD